MDTRQRGDFYPDPDTRPSDFYPASLLHKGDRYVDVDGFCYRVVDTVKDGWFVTITRDDDTEQRYYMSALLEVVELAP